MKLFGRDEKEIETFVKTTKFVTNDIRMSFGIVVHTLVLLCSRAKKNRYAIKLFLEKVLLSKRVAVERFKYIEIIEKGNISHNENEMKLRTKKEYLKRVRPALPSKLNGGHAFKAINTWAVAAIRYEALIIN